MKNLLLVAIGLLLFASCKKEESDPLTGRIYRRIEFPPPYGTVSHTDFTFETSNQCSLKVTYYNDTFSHEIPLNNGNYKKLDNSNFIAVWDDPSYNEYYYVSADSIYKIIFYNNDTFVHRENYFLRVQ